MEIKSEFKNELFKRHEIVAELEADKNPGFDEMRKKLSEKFKKPEENVDVLGIKGKFGKNVFIINADIYDSKDKLKDAIDRRKTQKQRKEEKKAQEEAKKAEAEAAKKAAEEAISPKAEETAA